MRGEKREQNSILVSPQEVVGEMGPLPSPRKKSGPAGTQGEAGRAGWRSFMAKERAGHAL